MLFMLFICFTRSNNQIMRSDNLNFSIAIITIILLTIISLILTLFVVKDVNQTLQKYEENEDTIQNELVRSHDYETSSLKVNIRTLTWLYTVLYLSVILFCLAFLFF